jgi:hypothetical protein
MRFLSGIRSRASYANVMATLAVFIALGGSSYAALKISGHDLDNRSVSNRKIERNTLTGLEIRESKLGTVPRASNALRLGGRSAADFKVRCPSGTFPTADACVERTPRAATPYGSAVLQCAQAGTPTGPGRRLPTHEELTAALAAVQLAPGGELTSNVYPSSTTPGRLDDLVVVDQVGGVTLVPDTAAGAKSFRCVTDPLN